MASQHARAAARRYATLRGALRAMAPAPELLDAGAIEGRFLETRRMLQSAGADGAQADPQELRKIDDALDGLARDLVATSDRVSFWQYRATLPVVLEQAPKDVEALLEVCMSGPERRWTDLVDYIVTLLATTDVGGRRSVRCDPSTAFACLDVICSQAAEEATENAVALEAQLAEACDALDRGDPVGDIVQRVRDIKRDATPEFFVPSVLRRVIAFNAAVHNRMSQQEETRRSLHAAEVDVLEELEAPRAATSDDLPAHGSFELGRIEMAVANRLARAKSSDRHAGRIAEAFDLSKLSAFEKQTFTQAADDPVARVVRSVIAIGLVLRHLDRVSDDLRAIGIDPEWMRRRATGEIDDLAQQGTRECMRGGNFDGARQLAELRSRYLNPLFDEERRQPAAPITAPVSAPTPHRPAERAVRPARRPAPPPRPRKPRARAARPEPRSHDWWRLPAIGAIALAVVTGVVLGALGRGGESAADGAAFTNAQLMELSPYLTSGYRSEKGSGDSFVGTVNAAWARASGDEQRTTAERMGSLLASRGITTIKLNDLAGSLRFHYENGSIRELR